MGFFKKNKNRMIVIVISIILLIIIGITSGKREKSSNVENLVAQILRPVGGKLYNIGNKISNVFSTFSNLSNLQKENESLKKEKLKLENQNSYYERVVANRVYLKKEYDLISKTDYNLTVCNITGKEPGNWYDRFTIDKGLNDGIKNGATIIQAIKIEGEAIQEGVVGRIVEVGNNWSKVISIIDESSNISFKSNRTQDGGIISGSVDGKLKGYLFDEKAKIRKGDKLYTSGLGGVFHKDLYLGRVTKVEKKEDELMKIVYVEPSIDFKKLHRVFIIEDRR